MQSVQYAATSALDSYVEAAKELHTLQPFVMAILDRLCANLSEAQINQLSSTWDSLALCFTSLDVSNSSLASRYLPFLWAKFKQGIFVFKNHLFFL